MRDRFRAVAAPALLAAAFAAAGCPKPSFLDKDNGDRSGGPAPAQPSVNEVRFTGQPLLENDNTPAPAGGRRPIGDKKAVHSYVRPAQGAQGDNAPWPGTTLARDDDDLFGMDIHDAAATSRLTRIPDIAPMGPGALGGTGVHVNPAEFSNGVYQHPDSLSSRINTADDIAGLMQMTHTTHGGDHNVTLSRDGKFMIYASTRWGKNPQIARQAVGGRAVQRLTQSSASDMMPAVSPDNQVLVWTSNRHGPWNLFARELDTPPTAAPVRLTQEDTDDLHPTWSHDGKLLAFSRYNAMAGHWELMVMDVRTRLVSSIGAGLFPTFCPVAKRSIAEGQPVYTLAFQNHRRRDIPFYSVWTMEVAFRHGKVEALGAPTEVVASADWAAITPVWSPDGEYLAYASVRQSPLANMQARIYRADDIWIVRADGSEPIAVTNHAAPDWYPFWAPEENNPMGRLYFTSARNGYPNVWSLRPNVPGMMLRHVRDGRMRPPR